jgi:hypothetical protein
MGETGPDQPVDVGRAHEWHVAKTYDNGADSAWEIRHSGPEGRAEAFGVGWIPKGSHREIGEACFDSFTVVTGHDEHVISLGCECGAHHRGHHGNPIHGFQELVAFAHAPRGSGG